MAVASGSEGRELLDTGTNRTVGVNRTILNVATIASGVTAGGTVSSQSTNHVQITIVGDGGVGTAGCNESTGLLNTSSDRSIGVNRTVLNVIAVATGITAAGTNCANATNYIQIAIVSDRSVSISSSSESR